MRRRETQQGQSGGQIEIREREYRQHMQHPLVEVTYWQSVAESYTFVFEEVDPACRRLEMAGLLLGHVPDGLVTGLRDAGYEIPESL